jgi:hypothetical protein
MKKYVERNKKKPVGTLHLNMRERGRIRNTQSVEKSLSKEFGYKTPVPKYIPFKP